MALLPRGPSSADTRRRRKGFLAAALVVALAGCHGQSGSVAVDENGNWEPRRDVTIVVPFAAGGGSDVFARNVAAGLEEVRPEVNIVVENRPGGSGAVGYGHLASKAGDPHTLLAVEPSRNLLPQQMDVPFAWDEWTNIGQLAEDVAILAVNGDAEWNTFEEFRAAAEKADEQGHPLRIALSAAGGVDEVLVYRLQEDSGANFETVVYDGTGETNPAVMSGDVDATLINPSDGRSEIQSGVFTPLLAIGPEKPAVEWMEDIPATNEFGWDIRVTNFRGIIAPQDVPDAAQEYWVSALRDASETARIQDYIDKNGLLESEYWGDDWNTFMREWNAEAFPILERNLSS